ncbi:ABC transporter ATP-binding protein/permease [Mariniplasma anaerobium]|uniref:Sulfate ABC transporter ATP-binding protein n=1 Tax=Mariniplasma anaerobium TaxID=2735436 RepID=A0A7U9XVV8_9MOLU|nr:ABC transporter ATP-binding protein/permease [Mariniplasma anaerobium]BCR36790.1 sulfate ABC transporter ATP-binding protein [Mariniplasma anaerobium]
MLQLKNIKKDYMLAGKPFPALKGIDLSFKENEFVSILGPSGCGKTTLLNIIGGLDRYTSGDLLIEGKSTKDFKDQDWDAYRNATIGFVFQTYNLISHLSVLDNVEMSLRLSGVSAKERKERAIKVLVDVGLEEHIYKKPNQLSGGQMQRVAIARSLVNNPKILLADEPTGALDSETSEQIMKLIEKISKDRLVIMVTHNAEIAEAHSDRIVHLLDGLVTLDSRPSEPVKKEKTEKLENKKTSMSYITAIKTSFKNLLTKKGRTIITALAGSIGIIGIALVLSISNGMTTYTNNIQSDALAGFPITVDQTVVAFGPPEEVTNPRPDLEYISDDLFAPYDSDSSLSSHQNIITTEFITYLSEMNPEYYNSISYTRGLSLNVVNLSDNGSYISVPTASSGVSFFGGSSYFNEMPNNPDFIQTQYDVIFGDYPTSYNQVVLIVDERNRIDLTLLEDLGINIEDEYTSQDLIGRTFKVVLNDLFYNEVGGVYIESTNYENMYNNSQILIEISGILRVKEEASSEILDTGIGYTSFLTDYLLNIEKDSNVVAAQVASPTINVLTGSAFNSTFTYDGVMRSIGGDATPVAVQIYPVSFEYKDEIKAYIDVFNVGLDETNQIIYTDLAETISGTISSLINTITIILAAFAAISLVVSSVMIGIITYVSVVERTKEIGIMRSLGARKKDISRIFNAETLLIGFTAGIFGIIVSFLLNIPINLLVERFIDVPNFASLPATSALFLIVLSTLLTLIAGLFPSRIAAKRDPVVALRTE